MVTFPNTRGSLVVSSENAKLKKKTILKKHVPSQWNQFLIPSLRTSVALVPYIFNHLRQPFTLQGVAFFLLVLWMNEGRLCLCFLGRTLRGCLTLWCAYWYETFYCPSFSAHRMHRQPHPPHQPRIPLSVRTQMLNWTLSLHLYIQINTQLGEQAL